MVFIVGLLAIIVIGLIHPLAPARRTTEPLVAARSARWRPVSVLLLLKAFSAGCSALTGVEAIANGVPLFKQPRVTRAKRTELLLGAILGAMLLGRGGAGRPRGTSGPAPARLVLSQIMSRSAVGRNWAYCVMSLTITLVLALAANTSFGGLPVLASLLAEDQLPAAPVFCAARRPAGVRARDLDARHPVRRAAHRGARQRADADPAVRHRRVHRLHAVAKRPGRALVAGPAAALGFRAALNGLGATVTAVATAVFILTKFTEGAWVVVIAVASLHLSCSPASTATTAGRARARPGEIPASLRSGRPW